MGRADGARLMDTLLAVHPGIAALRPPEESQSMPPFDAGWRIDGRLEPFLRYVEPLDVNWSDELEEMHEESTRDHFIDVHTRWALLRGIVPSLRPGALVVDVGCSSGYLLADLAAAHPQVRAIGLDVIARGLKRAHVNAPEAALILADCQALPLADASVDAVVSANVLEHVADDTRALREMRRVLKPGGLASVIVPAAPGLYDFYDDFLGHERRYARRELARRGSEAGLELVSDAYLGSLLYAPFWAVKKRNRRRARGLDAAGREALVRRQIETTEGSRLGEAACAAERSLLTRGVRLPFGIRSWTTFRRPA
jgi:SAM-dependent methyltransferase